MMHNSSRNHQRTVSDLSVESIGRQRVRRKGEARWPIVVSILTLAVLVLCLLNIRQQPVAAVKPTRVDQEPLIVYCAASNKSVVEAIRKDYEREFGTQVQVQYGPSQSLLASLEVSKTGDLYLPADSSFLDQARERDLIDEQIPIADMRALIAVPRGNPLKIETLEDMLHTNVRVAQANYEATAIGKLTLETLSAAGKWNSLKEHTTVFKTTVHEVANDVKVGAVDAGIVYDAVLHDYETLEGIKIPELSEIESRVAVAVLKSTERPRLALHFATYLSARDRGLLRYHEHGFEVVEGDSWSAEPELTLYAGSMLRPAIEKTISAFEAREGACVTRVYNGCGILVAQMKSGHVPDAYFACDSEFMNQVKDYFPVSKAISQNELVMIVPKGNPHEIATLKDLGKPGLRVGIGHEKQCAMGWITQRTFVESGLQSELMKNVVVQTPTGDMLVNQMRSGSLDAAVVYLSNAAGSADFLDAIRIRGLQCSVATQPFAVAKGSEHRRLAERLLGAIEKQSSRETFTSEGFQWLDDRQPDK